MTAHITAGGLSLFSERAPVSLYNTLNPCTLWFWITWSLCMSLNLWIKELLGQARRKLSITLLPELAEVQTLSQMNDHWPNYSACASGKVCMCFIICRWYRRAGHNDNDLVFIFRHTRALKQTRTFIHALMHTILWLLQPETGTVSSNVSNYLPSLSWNTDKTIPREWDKSLRIPGAKHD